jgi:hypothetical protein
VRKKVHYALDTSSDSEQEQSAVSDSSSYVPSDHTSTSSILGSTLLATVTRKKDLSAIYFPWEHGIRYVCEYRKLERPVYNPGDPEFSTVPFASDPKVLGQTSHLFYILLSFAA